MPHRTQTLAYHRWWWLQANRHVSGEILKLAARLGLDSTAADEWAAGVLAASGSKSPGQVLRSAWLAVMAEQLASPGAATAKSPLTLGEIRGLASGALPAKAGQPTGQVPSNALPSTAGLPSAQDPAVVAWVPRARSLIGGSNIPKAIVNTVVREILADPQFKPTGNREAAAQALAKVAFQQANLQYLADVKKVNEAARALEATLNQSGAQEGEVRAAADTLLAALLADDATSLPTEMTRVALRFAIDPRLSPRIRESFGVDVRGHGFQTDVSTASGLTALTYTQSLATNPQHTNATTQRLMLGRGLGGTTVPISVLEVYPPGVSAEASLLRQPGVAARLESAPAPSAEAEKPMHAVQVLYQIGGPLTQLRLRELQMSDAQWKKAESAIRRTYPRASRLQAEEFMFGVQAEFFRLNLNSLTEFSKVVSVSIGFGNPIEARIMLETIAKNPDKTFVLAAGNDARVLGSLTVEGERIDKAIGLVIGNTNILHRFVDAKNDYIDRRVQAELARPKQTDGNNPVSSGLVWRHRVQAETENALYAYYLSLFAKQKNAIVVGAGDLARGVWHSSNRDPFVVDISAPGEDLIYPYRKDTGKRYFAYFGGTSFAAPRAAEAIAYAERMSRVSPTDPGLLPEELIEMAVSTADKDPRFVGVNRANGPANFDRFKQTAALVGALRAGLKPVLPNETQAQMSARELADAELVKSAGKRLGIKPDRLAEIAPLAVDMVRRVNARLAASARQ